MRGRKPRPVELRVIEGNPGKRKLPEPVAIPAGLPEPPDHLDAEALLEWHRVIADLGVAGLITRPDRGILAAYCCAYSRWRLAEQKIASFGHIVRHPSSGKLVQSPWVTISNQAMLLMHKFGTEFGMTSVSRARVATPAGDDAKNPFAQFG